MLLIVRKSSKASGEKKQVSRVDTKQSISTVHVRFHSPLMTLARTESLQGTRLRALPAQRSASRREEHRGPPPPLAILSSNNSLYDSGPRNPRL